MKRRKKKPKYLNDSNTSFHCGNRRRPTITGEKVWKEENAGEVEKGEEEEDEEEEEKEEEEEVKKGRRGVRRIAQISARYKSWLNKK